MKFKRSILICLSSLNARICLWRCTLIYKHVASVISRFRVFKESFNEIFVIPRNMGEEEPSTRMKWCAEARFKRVSRYVLSSKLLHHYWCVRGTVKHSFHGVILETALCNVHPQKARLGHSSAQHLRFHHDFHFVRRNGGAGSWFIHRKFKSTKYLYIAYLFALVSTCLIN